MTASRLRRRLNPHATGIQAVDRDERQRPSVTGGVTARAKGLPPRLRAVLARGRRLVGGALRPGRRAALAAGVGCAAYGALKLYWALGGELLLREAPLSADQRRALLEGTPGALITVENWASVALAAIGIALALAIVRDRRLPRLLVVGLPALVGAFMLARAALGAGDVAVLTGAARSTYNAGWDLALWSPFFAAWGAAWGLAGLAARRRTAGRPRRHAHRPPSPHRAGPP